MIQVSSHWLDMLTRVPKGQSKLCSRIVLPERQSFMPLIFPGSERLDSVLICAFLSTLGSNQFFRISYNVLQDCFQFLCALCKHVLLSAHLRIYWSGLRKLGRMKVGFALFIHFTCCFSCFFSHMVLWPSLLFTLAHKDASLLGAEKKCPHACLLPNLHQKT